MKKYILISIIFIYPQIKLHTSDLSDVLNRIESFTFCQIPLYTNIPGMAENCAETNPDGKLVHINEINNKNIDLRKAVIDEQRRRQ
jgi:hypothetical protein